MVLSGFAWGVYSLMGVQSKSPLFDGAASFLWLSIPSGMFLLLTNETTSHEGVLLAITSGAITSGLAYSLWYYLSTSLTVAFAAILQLMVPIIATVMGVLVLNESLTLQFLIATVIVILGVLIKSLNFNTLK